jgi:glyoxylase-like metal-dependent hydrolase (beta-lactamase superfamily II)
MKIEMMTTGFYFTNSYIISNDNKECIIIDPGLGYVEVANAIKKTYKPLAILITHAHMDHIDGIKYFNDLPIYLYKDEIRVFNDSNLNLYEMIGRKSPFDGMNLNIIKVSDLEEINISDFKFKVYHTPGHTPGSCCYLMGNDLFTGDTLFNESCGRCDFPGGSFSQMEESLERIMNTFNDNVKCYPGHNDITDIGYERIHNPFIK